MGRTHFFFLKTAPNAILYGRNAILQWKSYALLPNREWNQRQKHKKQPWSKMECFAFGGATVRFASLATSFHAANHTGHSTNDRCEALASPKGYFLCFCFSAASIFCVVGFVRWGYFWGDNNFWGWCYVIGLEFVCAYARIVIFS